MKLLNELYQLLQEKEADDEAIPDNEVAADDEEAPVKAKKKVPPAEDDELADQEPTPADDKTENEDEPADTPDETEEADAEDDEDAEESAEDVGSVAAAQGFTKDSKELYAFGRTRKVTTLTKNEELGGLDITLQYVINPKTGAWSLRACLAGQSDEDMVEFTTGEDPSSLIKSLQKKRKITPHQAVEYLNPRADQVLDK